MCMLCVIPPNTIPSREKLENSALNNPDGFGFAIAIRKENRIHVETTMNPDTSINRFLEMRNLYPEGYAMWHARLATHGATNIENCHPFKVGGSDMTYLAHNGILSVLMEKGEKRSDTRVFAEDVLPAMGGVYALDNPQLFNVLEDFCSGSKVCVLTIDPNAKAECYLLNEKSGKIDDTGVWWSNDSCDLSYYGNRWYSRKSLSHLFHNDYESAYGVSPSKSVRNPNSLAEADYLADEGQIEYDEYGLYPNTRIDYSCSVCRLEGSMSYEKMATEGYCPFCQCCLDCTQEKVDCLCYIPAFVNEKLEF